VGKGGASQVPSFDDVETVAHHVTHSPTNHRRSPQIGSQSRVVILKFLPITYRESVTSERFVGNGRMICMCRGSPRSRDTFGPEAVLCICVQHVSLKPSNVQSISQSRGWLWGRQIAEFYQSLYDTLTASQHVSCSLTRVLINSQ
jgi:hypothetical protein